MILRFFLLFVSTELILGYFYLFHDNLSILTPPAVLVCQTVAKLSADIALDYKTDILATLYPTACEIANATGRDREVKVGWGGGVEVGLHFGSKKD